MGTPIKIIASGVFLGEKGVLFIFSGGNINQGKVK